MTAAADRPARSDRRRPFGTVFVVGALAAGCLAACTGSDPDSGGGSAGAAGSVSADGAGAGGAGPASSASPAEDLDAIRATVDRINQGAGGPVEAQQALLAQAVNPPVDPAVSPPAEPPVDPQLDPQVDPSVDPPVDTQGPPATCPAATTTVALEPAYRELTARADLAPAGAEQGQTYLLPAVVRVYVADRRTTTDLTLLRFTVAGGIARMAQVCVR